MQVRRILQQFDFFKEAETRHQDQLAAAASARRYQPGKNLYRCGDPGLHLALVGEGRVRVFQTNTTGREISLYHVSQGQACLANILAVLGEQRAPATAVAETPTTVCLLPKAQVQRSVVELDSFRQFLFESLSDRFLEVLDLIEEVAFGSMRQRLARHLLARSVLKNGCRLRVLETTHHEIAGKLGSAREVISRLLEDFQRGSLIRLSRGSIQLKDEHLLRSLAEM